MAYNFPIVNQPTNTGFKMLSLFLCRSTVPVKLYVDGVTSLRYSVRPQASARGMKSDSSGPRFNRPTTYPQDRQI